METRASRRRNEQSNNGTGHGANGATGAASPNGGPPLSPFPATSLVTMSSGVIFQLKPYNRYWLNDWMLKEPPPRPPVVNHEDSGITEENTQDPDYQAKLSEHVNKQWKRTRDFMIMTGTSVHWVPEGVPELESADWLALCESMNMDLPADRPGRYLAWCRMIAILNYGDDLTLTRELSRLTGTLEEDVSRALAGFQRAEERGADPGSGDEAHGPDGDRVGAVSPDGSTGA